MHHLDYHLTHNKATNPSVLNDSPEGNYTFTQGMTTAQAEALMTVLKTTSLEMIPFSIEKSTVRTKSRNHLKPNTLWQSYHKT